MSHRINHICVELKNRLVQVEVDHSEDVPAGQNRRSNERICRVNWVDEKNIYRLL